MSNNPIEKAEVFARLEEIQGVKTAHEGGGTKFVLAGGSDCESPVTQAAYGILKPGEFVEEHAHATMEEFFYFLSGRGEKFVGDETFELSEGAFARIPPTVPHGMRNTGDAPLVFVYWGVATD